MRAYLTGGHGFAGGYLKEHLVETGDDVILAPLELDIVDFEGLAASVGSAQPDVIYHLAAQAHVGTSWEAPAETYRVNVLGTLAVLEAARRLPTPPTVLLVSSAEVYGAGGEAPFAEDAPMRPVSPYAASKASAELVGLQAFLGSGLAVVRVRPFNHVGPAQSERYLVSALARRIVAAERSGGGTVKVGNLAPARDFTDVRDVVRAYRELARQGVAGEVYNICTGEGHTVQQVADLLIEMAQLPVELEVDPDLYRPADVPVLVGDPTAVAGATGWKAEIPLAESLRDVLDWWRSQE